METISQMSLLEVAVQLMEQKRAPQSIRLLIKEALEMKGLEDPDHTLAAQLYSCWKCRKYNSLLEGL